MASKAFKKIMAGLEDALAYSKGDTSRGRVATPTPALTDIDVARLRKDLDLSQETFASLFQISIGTLRNWEQGRRRPEGPARVLLNVIRKNPQPVLATVWPKSVGRRTARDRRASG